MENIDVSKNVMTQVTPEMLDKYDKIICMAQSEYTPTWLTDHVNFIRWDIKDPGGKGLKETREALEIVKAKVIELIRS